jgi:PTH1 family peptidyl-tRNA hydrolase
MLKRFIQIFFPEKSEPDTMKYLIAGLGNIGAEYENTRHNVGFQVLDTLAKAADISFKSDHLGAIATLKHKGRTLILLKPSTYMNRSGKSVRYWLQKENIPKENLLVVLDDLNLPFGKQRLRPQGSDGGHNGLKDIDEVTGGNDYARLRIGIGSDFSKGKQVDFVLGAWSPDEAEELKTVLEYAANTVKSFATIGLQLTMTQFNKKG